MTTDDGMPYEEKKRLGEEIYNAQIRPLIGPEDENKYVIVDVLTGDYEVDENPASAGRKLRARRPDGVMHAMHRHKTRVIRIRSPIRQIGRVKATE